MIYTFLFRRPSLDTIGECSLLNSFSSSFARGDNLALFFIAFFIISALSLAILDFGFILNGKVRKLTFA